MSVQCKYCTFKYFGGYGLEHVHKGVHVHVHSEYSTQDSHSQVLIPTSQVLVQTLRALNEPHKSYVSEHQVTCELYYSSTMAQYSRRKFSSVLGGVTSKKSVF